MTKLSACIVAVGSEMLTPFRLDTNSLVVTEQLNAIGYDVRLKVVVGAHFGSRLPGNALFVALAFGLSIGVALLSWHALEAPFLRLKRLVPSRHTSVYDLTRAENA